MFRVSAAGGEPEVLTSPEASERHFWPEVLPGGNAVVFAVLGPPGDAGQIAVLDLETGEQRVLIQAGTHPRYVSTGYLAYSFENQLWAVRFDADRLEVLGDPFLVLEGVPTSSTGGVNVDVSDNGTLVYQPGKHHGKTSASSCGWTETVRKKQLAWPRAPLAVYGSPLMAGVWPSICWNRAIATCFSMT